jgi:hypothetical protein
MPEMSPDMMSKLATPEMMDTMQRMMKGMDPEALASMMKQSGMDVTPDQAASMQQQAGSLQKPVDYIAHGADGQAQPNADAVADGGCDLHAARGAGRAAGPRLAACTPARHGSNRSAVPGPAVAVAWLGLTARRVLNNRKCIASLCSAAWVESLLSALPSVEISFAIGGIVARLHTSDRLLLRQLWDVNSMSGFQNNAVGPRLYSVRRASTKGMVLSFLVALKLERIDGARLNGPSLVGTPLLLCFLVPKVLPSHLTVSG